MGQRIGLVLAGGRGRRLGRPKADFRLGSITLAERAARVLWPVCGDVLVSVEPGTRNPAPGFSTVADSPPVGRGPLAGIHAAFEVTGQADLLVLACDYPRVDTSLMRAISGLAREEDDLVLLSDDRGRDHPLVALWKRRTAARVAEALAGGLLKVRSLLGAWNVRRVGSGELPGVDLATVLLNVNWPDDLAALAADRERAADPAHAQASEERAWED